MIKLIITCIITFFIIAGIALTISSLTNKEKWELTKIIFWCTICSVVTISVLSLIVLLF